MPPFAAPQVDNRARFEQLLRPQLDALYANGLRLTHSPSDAQDLVQETVLRAYRFFDRFESGTNFKAWLLRIQYNAFVNDYRRRGLERQVRHTLEEEGRGGGVMSRQALASLSDPEGQALRPLLAAELSEALAELPEDQQQMVLLADVEELKYKEIAEIVGSPIGTVMSKLHRARLALATAYGEQDE